MSVIQAQKLQRMRVNRVAIVQAVKVDHILPGLIAARVLTEEDKQYILRGKTPEDKTRSLIDLLPQKGSSVDWYGQFVNALINPNTRNKEVKKKYRMVIDFLDNTIIQKPPKAQPVVSPVDSSVSKKSFPRYEPLPTISNSNSKESFQTNESQVLSLQDGATSSNIEEEKGTKDKNVSEKMHKSSPRGKVNVKSTSTSSMQNPANFATLIKEPREIFESLESSGTTEDIELLKQEKSVLQHMRHLETVIALNSRNLLPDDFTLCTSEAVEDVLKDREVYHLYFKYLNPLRIYHKLNIMYEVSSSFIKLLEKDLDAKDEELRRKLTNIGFGLFDFLKEYTMYDKAEMVLLSLMMFLSQCHEIENWMALYEGLIRMMEMNNIKIEFKEVDSNYHSALGIIRNIKLMSFGKDLIDESGMFMELSNVMREQGSIGPAFQWAQKAIREVEPDNHRGIIEVLCSASIIYAQKWNVKRCEDLVVEAVRQAKEHFGVNHPLYIKSLLHYVMYSNEFLQEDMGIEVARVAVKTAEKIYGGAPSLQRATAHMLLGKALMAKAQFDNDEYFNECTEAWKLAMDVVPGGHPQLAHFRYTMAQCLQLKATQASGDQKEGLLIWAESEARAAMYIYKSNWGMFSIKLAQSYSLLGQIYTKMDRMEDAQKMLTGADTIFKLSVPTKSNYNYLSRATLGTFYKTIDKPVEAITLFTDVVDNADSGGVYSRWIHICYETVIALYKQIGKDKEADLYEAGLHDWAKKMPKWNGRVTWESLNEKPQMIDDFEMKFFKLSEKIQRNKKGLKNLYKNLGKSKRS